MLGDIVSNDSTKTSLLSSNNGYNGNKSCCPASPHEKELENYLDNLLVSYIRRFFMQLEIFILFGNTLSAIFSISAAVSLIPRTDYSYDFCDWGNPTGYFVQCPYLPSPAFGTCLAVWTLYFTTIFLYRFQRCLPYYTHDVRFYLACDMINNELFIQIMVYIGFVFTFASALAGIYYSFHNGTENTLGSILVFLVVNIHSLYGMLGGRYKKLQTIINLEEVFPSPIYLKSSNFPAAQKPFITLRDFFDALAERVFHAQVLHDDKIIEEIGDIDQIKFVTNLLMSNEPKE